MNSNFTITVFTPTYQRATTLGRVYDGLLNQTFKDFEWIIIDDGSTDNTEELVSKIIEDSKLSNVTYIKNEANMHKFFCLIKAIEIAKGNFFICIDSDDTCKPNSFETFLQNWDQIKEKDKFVGVCFLANDQNGNLIGDKFPSSPFDSDVIETSIKYKITGDKWAMNKTDILKKYVFSKDYFNNGLIPEGVLWFSIAHDKFKTRYFNVPLLDVFVGSVDSISKSNDLFNNRFGRNRIAAMVLNFGFKYFLDNPWYIIKNLLIYSITSKLSNDSFKEMSARITNYFLKFCLIILYPFSLYIYRIIKIK